VILSPIVVKNFPVRSRLEAIESRGGQPRRLTAVESPVVVPRSDHRDNSTPTRSGATVAAVGAVLGSCAAGSSRPVAAGRSHIVAADAALASARH